MIKVDIKVPNLDNMEIPLPCPKCNKDFKIKAKDMENGKTVTCPNCKSSIELKTK